MTLASHYTGTQCAISFELFPPKTEAGMDSLCDNVRRLTEFQPSFFTCTYGAGGSTREKTLQVLQKVRQITDAPVASHLTCVGATVEQLENYLAEAQEQQTDYIVALRGDPPQGTDQFVAVEGGLKYANELVELIRTKYSSYGIAVAGYPETHQEAVDAQTDLENLKRKVDAGADLVITQLFYDNVDFFRFRDRCEQAGINVPIIPGILPVTNFKQAQRIASMCKANIPASLQQAMIENDDPAGQFEIGVEHARKQTLDLVEQGVPGIHYYVLNKSEAAAALLDGTQLASAAR
ncbi:MAG: methylenetetrahydrofolate reductase [NAD(P)H] [Planctomycetaceae bacterium]|nr:methylenetetrahydrofolate reductase [NAD(P)H] [Planctomycetaceae bacterium]